MDTIELFQRLAMALAIGLLIGVERGWQAREEAEGERAAGLRTHALVALAGGVLGAIALRVNSGDGVLLAIGFAVIGGTTVLFRFREVAHEGTFGATTAIATLLAFALGALAVVGDMAVAGAGGVAVAGLLALKSVLHGWLKRMTWPELRSALVLAAMTFLMLPVLPRRALDPLGAFNPFELWLLTVMLAAISFAGYVAVKLAGERRGIALTGLAGGLASSTAVTVSLARLGRDRPGEAGILAGGALLAGATMMGRVLVLAGVVQPALLDRLVLPLGLAAIVTAAIGLALVARSAEGSGSGRPELALGNPLDLGAVLKFGALLTAVGLLTRIATRVAGSAGAYGLAALSGLADVDAITLSMARLGGGSIALETAAGAVLLAVLVNTITKIMLAWVAGGRQLGRWMALGSFTAIVAGGVGLWVGPLALGRLLTLA